MEATTTISRAADAEQTLKFARRQLIRAMRGLDGSETRKAQERTAIAVSAIDDALESLEGES